MLSTVFYSVITLLLIVVCICLIKLIKKSNREERYALRMKQKQEYPNDKIKNNNLEKF